MAAMYKMTFEVYVKQSDDERADITGKALAKAMDTALGGYAVIVHSVEQKEGSVNGSD